MATMTDVPKSVVDILVAELGVDESQITPDALLIYDLGADSLDIVELSMAFEEAFGLAEMDDIITTRWHQSTVREIVKDLRARGAKV